MAKKIYIGCLPGEALESELLEIFSKYGTIVKINLMRKKGHSNPTDDKEGKKDPNEIEKCVGSGHLICGDEETYNKILKS